MKIDIHEKTCTQKFTEALFILNNNWKQRKCLSVDEWTRRVWYSVQCTIQQ